MTAKRRFAWWAIVVVGWLAVAPARLDGSDAAWVFAGSVQTLILAMLLWLLGTTPANAIKLRGQTSWTFIGTGVWLNLACATPFHTPVVLIAAATLAVLVPMGVWSTVLARGRSPWWVVLVAWNPALPVLIARPVMGEPVWIMLISRGVSVVALLVAFGVVGVLSGADRGKESGGECDSEGSGVLWRGVWLLGFTTFLSGFVPMLSIG